MNVVGIDGYYRRSDTSESVFGTTINEIRRFSRTPIFISETATEPVADPAKDQQPVCRGPQVPPARARLVRPGAESWGLPSDWWLEDSPAAFAAFRKALNR